MVSAKQEGQGAEIFVWQRSIYLLIAKQDERETIQEVERNFCELGAEPSQIRRTPPNVGKLK